MNATKRARQPPGRAVARRDRQGEEEAPLLRASLAVSLDGYIADAAGEVAWLDPYFSPEIDFAAFARTIGATVMGRATWDWGVRHGHADKAGERCIVQTHRPLADAPPRVEAFAGDARDLAAILRRELRGAGKDVWLMGGGESLASFDQHGLVDRWELAVMPVFLGEGVRLFPRRARPVTPLRLVRSRALGNGVVQVEYEPVRSATT